MSNQDAQKEFLRVFYTTMGLFNKLSVFHSIAIKGTGSGVEEEVKKQVEFINKEFDDETLKTVMGIEDAGQKKTFMEHLIDQMPKRITPEFTNLSEAAVEAACIVFAHGIVDACTYEYLNVISLAAPNLWDSWIEMKEIKIELSKAKKLTYEQLRDERIRTFLEKKVERESLCYKLDLLHKIAPPEPEIIYSVYAYKYDKERILQLDNTRHNIVHKNIWEHEWFDFEEELKYWNFLNNYLSKLVTYNTSLELRPILSLDESK